MNRLGISRSYREEEPEEPPNNIPENLGPGCARCCSFFKNEKFWRLEVKVSDLRDELTAKGSIECPACRLLWDGVYAVVGLDIHAYDTFSINERGPDISMDVEARSPWTTVGKGYHIATEGLAGSCVELARTWLKECTTRTGKHVNAGCFVESLSILPKRVIDVMNNRLYQPSFNEKSRYVALSHCWGGRTPVRTTRDTLAAHLKALPSPLPATFRDAVAVTKALGARFLWIDSLCIIQDDTDDWRREAAHMATIYENALVTISADAASCSTDGFLAATTRQSKPHAEVPYRFTDADGHDVEGTVCVRERGQLGLLLPYHGLAGSRSQKDTDDSWVDEPDAPRSVLSTRGWVFQERILSPRTLHFSEFEMAWECRSICTCECSATSYRPYVYQSLLKGLLAVHEDQAYFHKLWRVEVVQEYSRMALTFPQDRLIALAGLATAVGRLRPGDRYLAGMWRSTLKEDLLWAVQPVQASARLSTRPAASWSWGSVTGAVAYGRSSRHDVDRRRMSGSFKVDEVAVASSQEDPFTDPLAGSKLKVTGQVLRGKLAGDAELNKMRFVPEDWAPNYTYSSSLSALPDGPFLVAWDVMTAESSRDDSEPYKGKQLLFIMMAEQLGGPCGLLLEQSEPSSRWSRPRCRRVGSLAVAVMAPDRKVDVLGALPARIERERIWNTKNLGLRLGSDLLAAASAAAMVAPVISIIDRSIMENASGSKTLGDSIKFSFRTLLLRPHALLFSKPAALIFLVYGSTYLTANTLDTVSSTVANKSATTVTAGTAKFAASSAANIGVCIYKDQVFVRMFGPPGVVPRPVPPASYALFAIRDCITIFASFNVPPLLGPWINERMGAELRRKVDGMTVAQFMAPAAVQAISTPLHLLGLDLYNRPGSGAVVPWNERWAAVRKNWAISVAARIGRIIPAFGVGGVVNTKVRRNLMERLT
ncbi:hypothetical protein ACHAQH_007472 [Verticillium albo-atrum]